MPVPLPDDATVLHRPPDAREVMVISRAIVSAISPPTGLTDLQTAIVEATTQAMTGYPATIGGAPLTPAEFGEAMAVRDLAFRQRMVQFMLLGALVLRPLPPEVVSQVEAFAAELGVDDGMLRVAQRYAEGNLGLAAFDFNRNGYVADWSADKQRTLHTSKELAGAWDLCVNDADLAGRWQALESLPEGSLGERLTTFYRARGFSYPGQPHSAPPLLAQHDWVHVLADYGSTVESELEVFGFISRANDDPRGFSLLAMVVSLFETGYSRADAGLFESSVGWLSREGVAVRLADAMRRGARCHDTVTGHPDVDFLALDWFELAPLPCDEVRARFNVVPKSDTAISWHSVSPFGPGGISEFQWRSGQEAAAAAGRAYDPAGASVAPSR